MSHTCVVKMFSGPKGKWPDMACIWIEKLSIPKLSAVKCPLDHARMLFGWAQAKTSLEILLITTYIQLQDSTWALLFINIDMPWIWPPGQGSLLIIILPVPLCLFFSLSGITGYCIQQPGILRSIPTPDQDSFPSRKGYGAAEQSLPGEILRQSGPCLMESKSCIGQGMTLNVGAFSALAPMTVWE